MGYDLEGLIERYGVTDAARLDVGCDLVMTVDSSRAPGTNTVAFAALLGGADGNHELSVDWGILPRPAARDAEAYGLVAALGDFVRRGKIPFGCSLLVRNDNDLALRFLSLQIGELGRSAMGRGGRSALAQDLRDVLQQARLSKLVVRHVLGHRHRGSQDPAASLCDTLAKSHMKHARRQEMARRKLSIPSADLQAANPTASPSA